MTQSSKGAHHRDNTHVRNPNLLKIAAVLASTLLAACNMTTKDGTPIIREGPLPGDGTFLGTVQELTDPGSTYRNREAADDLRCRQFGFKPGTDAYGNCRLQREQIRATEHAGRS